MHTFMHLTKKIKNKWPFKTVERMHYAHWFLYTGHTPPLMLQITERVF